MTQTTTSNGISSVTGKALVPRPQKLVKLDRSKKAEKKAEEKGMAKELILGRFGSIEELQDDARAAAELYSQDKAYRTAFRAQLESLKEDLENRLAELRDALGESITEHPSRAPSQDSDSAPAKRGRKPSGDTEALRDSILAAIKKAGKDGISAGEIKKAIGDDKVNVSILLKGASGYKTKGERRAMRYYPA